MDFSNGLYIAYLEEDDAQHSLFRLQPMLSPDGPISQEELEELGDEGFIRIVPDRAEQYTFKERLRGILPLCLVDLRGFPPEAHKLRPNKNYAPGDEVNRLVLYSDCVRALEPGELFEVVSDPLLKRPLTHSYYLRRGGHIDGPYDRDELVPSDALNCIAPDSDRLYALSLPDGRERLFLWLGAPERDETVEAVEQEEAPVERSPRLRLRKDTNMGTRRLRAEAKQEAPEPMVEEDVEEPQEALLPRQAALLEEDLRSAGFLPEENDGLCAILHLLQAKQLVLSTACPEDAKFAASTIAGSLGMETREVYVGDGGHQLVLNATAGRNREEWHLHVLPSGANPAAGQPQWELKAQQGFDLPPLPETRPLADVHTLRREAAEAKQALNEQTAQSLQGIEEALLALGQPLPLRLKRDLLAFLTPAQGLLPGGEQAALDRALLHYLLPRLQGTGMAQSLAAQLEELPLSAAWLNAR